MLSDEYTDREREENLHTSEAPDKVSIMGCASVPLNYLIMLFAQSKLDFKLSHEGATGNKITNILSFL